MYYKQEKVIRQKYNDLTRIDWQLGNYCNFQCRYCFPGANEGNIRLNKFNNTVFNNLFHLKSQLANVGKQKLIWSLSGGEPTMFHDFEKFIKWIKMQGDITSVISNGSRSKKWWTTNITNIDKLIISHHYDQGNVMHLIDLLTVFSQADASIHVMIDDMHINKCIDDYYLLYQAINNQYKIRLQPKILRRNSKIGNPYYEDIAAIVNLPTIGYSSSRTSDETTIITEQSIFRCVNSDINLYNNLQGSWKDYRCYAHHNYFQILTNGDIGTLTCGQKFFNTINIYDNNFSDQFLLNSGPLICNQDRICNCLGLLNSTKMI